MQAVCYALLPKRSPAHVDADAREDVVLVQVALDAPQRAARAVPADERRRDLPKSMLGTIPSTRTLGQPETRSGDRRSVSQTHWVSAGLAGEVPALLNALVERARREEEAQRVVGALVRGVAGEEQQLLRARLHVRLRGRGGKHVHPAA